MEVLVPDTVKALLDQAIFSDGDEAQFLKNFTSSCPPQVSHKAGFSSISKTLHVTEDIIRERIMALTLDNDLSIEDKFLMNNYEGVMQMQLMTPAVTLTTPESAKTCSTAAQLCIDNISEYKDESQSSSITTTRRDSYPNEAELIVPISHINITVMDLNHTRKPECVTEIPASVSRTKEWNSICSSQTDSEVSSMEGSEIDTEGHSPSSEDNQQNDDNCAQSESESETEVMTAKVIQAIAQALVADNEIREELQCCNSAATDMKSSSGSTEQHAEESAEECEATNEIYAQEDEHIPTNEAAAQIHNEEPIPDSKTTDPIHTEQSITDDETNTEVHLKEKEHLANETSVQIPSEEPNSVPDNETNSKVHIQAEEHIADNETIAATYEPFPDKETTAAILTEYSISENLDVQTEASIACSEVNKPQQSYASTAAGCTNEEQTLVKVASAKDCRSEEQNQSNSDIPELDVTIDTTELAAETSANDTESMEIQQNDNSTTNLESTSIHNHDIATKTLASNPLVLVEHITIYSDITDSDSDEGSSAIIEIRREFSSPNSARVEVEVPSWNETVSDSLFNLAEPGIYTEDLFSLDEAKHRNQSSSGATTDSETSSNDTSQSETGTSSSELEELTMTALHHGFKNINVRQIGSHAPIRDIEVVKQHQNQITVPGQELDRLNTADTEVEAQPHVTQDAAEKLQHNLSNNDSELDGCRTTETATEPSVCSSEVQISEHIENLSSPISTDSSVNLFFCPLPSELCSASNSEIQNVEDQNRRNGNIMAPQQVNSNESKVANSDLCPNIDQTKLNVASKANSSKSSEAEIEALACSDMLNEQLQINNEAIPASQAAYGSEVEIPTEVPVHDSACKIRIQNDISVLDSEDKQDGCDRRDNEEDSSSFSDITELSDLNSAEMNATNCDLMDDQMPILTVHATFRVSIDDEPEIIDKLRIEEIPKLLPQNILSEDKPLNSRKRRPTPLSSEKNRVLRNIFKGSRKEFIPAHDLNESTLEEPNLIRFKDSSLNLLASRPLLQQSVVQGQRKKSKTVQKRAARRSSSRQGSNPVLIENIDESKFPPKKLRSCFVHLTRLSDSKIRKLSARFVQQEAIVKLKQTGKPSPDTDRKKRSAKRIYRTSQTVTEEENPKDTSRKGNANNRSKGKLQEFSIFDTPVPPKKTPHVRPYVYDKELGNRRRNSTTSGSTGNSRPRSANDSKAAAQKKSTGISSSRESADSPRRKYEKLKQSISQLQTNEQRSKGYTEEAKILPRGHKGSFQIVNDPVERMKNFKIPSSSKHERQFPNPKNYRTNQRTPEEARTHHSHSSSASVGQGKGIRLTAGAEQMSLRYGHTPVAQSPPEYSPNQHFLNRSYGSYGKEYFSQMSQSHHGRGYESSPAISYQEEAYTNSYNYNPQHSVIHNEFQIHENSNQHHFVASGTYEEHLAQDSFSEENLTPLELVFADFAVNGISTSSSDSGRDNIGQVMEEQIHSTDFDMFYEANAAQTSALSSTESLNNVIMVNDEMNPLFIENVASYEEFGFDDQECDTNDEIMSCGGGTTRNNSRGRGYKRKRRW